MPTIIVQAHPTDHEPGLVTLTERIITENLESAHYARQLLERLRWAAADAEAIEVPPPETPAHSAARTPHRQARQRRTPRAAGVAARGGRPVS